MTIYHVPCNGCTLCCWNDAVRILDTENANRWKTEPHPRYQNRLMLAHKPDGSCWYLGEHGCTIQNSKPQQCYEMDCRHLATCMTYTEARKYNINMAVWKKGRELLKKPIDR